MSEQARTRDCVALVKGDSFTVTVSPSMVTSGWPGGVGVRWVTPTKDEEVVGISDGLHAGFCLWGSNESSDQYTAMTQNQPAYQFAVIGAGGWTIMTTTFEQYTLASRLGPGPLVPLTYDASDRLYFSLRGYWTKELEGPNASVVGTVIQKPSTITNNYMTIQTFL